MREKSKLRENDVNASNIVSDFLESNFYSVYTDNFKRINDAENQFKGIDCIFSFNNKEYICDEKAAIQYINKPLYTFALELSFIDLGNSIHDGWLIDEKKVNNSFLFVWIDNALTEILSSKDDIISMEIALLDRQVIIDYLASKGWNKENLLLKMKRIRENEFENLGNLYKNGLKFTKSPHLVEQPINVLLSREKLIELSDFNLKLPTTHNSKKA